MNIRLQPLYLLVALSWTFCLTSFSVSAQSGGVFEGDLSLTTQTDIDAFDYQEVTGDLFIGNSPNAVCAFPINDLSPLAKLIKVGGYLWISGTQHLSSLDGLDHLTRIGNDLLINNNSKLENLKGLNGLCSVNGRVTIDSNPQLHSLEGLERLHTIGGNLEIQNNTNLTSLKGLHNLKTIGTKFIITATGIANFRGLDQLVSIGGNLAVYNNERLISLEGIDSLLTIGGDLDISFNPILTNCCIIPSLEDVVEGSIIIRNNAPVCSSLEAIKENCDESPVAEIDCSQENIVLTTQAEVDAFECTTVTNLKIDFNSGRGSADPITNLDQLSTLTEVGGDLDLSFLFDNSRGIDLSGLNNLKRVEGNLSFDGTEPSFNGLQKLEFVGGNLTFYRIGEADDFSALTNLRYVGGELSIITSRVESFQGLAQLTSVGGFDLNESTVFSFEGLTSLVQIRGDLRAEQEDSNIRSLEGLENVERITGSLTIFGANYPSFQGLNNLEQIGGDLITSETGIDLTGLESLQTVGGNLFLGRVDGAGIVNVEALSNLQTVGGDFNIENTSAEDLSALASLQNVAGNLIVRFNPNLSDCCIIPSLVDKVDGTITVRNNAPTCSSLEAIAENCDEPLPGTDCSQESIVLTTQAEVDAFACTTVANLTINFNNNGEDMINNLNRLSSLTEVSGNLELGYLSDNRSGVDLSGLNNLKRVGGNLYFNGTLPSFDGLQGLEYVGGDLMFYRIDDADDFSALANLRYVGGELSIITSRVESFQGLAQLTSVGGFDLNESTVFSFEGLTSLVQIRGDLRAESEDRNIRSLRGLESVERITGSLTIMGFNYPDFQGLNNLKQIGGNLSITDESNVNLTGLESLRAVGGDIMLRGVDVALIGDLNALSNLQTVGGNFAITGTTAEDLSALASLQNVAGNLFVSFNPNLSDCCIIPSLIEKVNGATTIDDNAPECSSLEAIEENCNEETTEENARTAQDLHAFPNPSENFVQIRVDQPTSVQLFNTAGYLVKEQRVEQEDIIDLTTIKSGVYLLKTPGGKVQRIIKK